MTPEALTVRIVRTVHGAPTVGSDSSRDLLVSQIIPSLRGDDWRVSLWWGRGVGEVEFSLYTGKQWGSRGRRSRWWLTPESARQVLAVGRDELVVPRRILSPLWWASE